MPCVSVGVAIHLQARHWAIADNILHSPYMRFLFALALCSISIISLYGQAGRTHNFRPWGDSLAALYATTNSATNFYERLDVTLNNFMLVDNKIAVRAIAELEEKYQIGVDSALQLFFDSTVKSFVRNHWWDELPGLVEKYKTFFDLYTQQMCPCMTEQATKSRNGVPSDEGTKECVRLSSANLQYRNASTRLLTPLEASEQQKILYGCSLYLFENCPAVYGFMTKSIAGVTLTEYRFQEKNRMDNIPDSLSVLLTHDRQSLSLMFPDYANYTADLRIFQQIKKISDIQTFRKEKMIGGGQFSQTNYLYTVFKDKVILEAELVYVLSRRSSTARILSFQITPVAKLENAKNISAEIHKMLDEMPEPPPPPIGELRPIRKN